MRRCIKRSRTSLANGKLLTAAGETFHQTLCQDGWAEFLNAGSVISTDGVDGLHLEPICDYHTFGKLFCVIFGAIFLLLRYLAATLLKDGCVLPQTKAGCGVAWDKHAVEHYRLR
jgi:hypothetical protein